MSSAMLNEMFWEVGGFKSTVRRIRDGADQLDELSKMVRERMEIEQKYAKSLNTWHSKWSTQVDSMSVSGTAIRQAWTSLLDEGNELARAHSTVKDRLKDELINTIGVFRKSNYHHSALRGCREANDVDEDFEKAQRQWRKLSERVEAAKKAYHSACRAEKSAYIQLMNSRGDSSTTNESGDKTRENYEKWREEVKKTRANYENAIREINSYQSVYSESMTFVFEKCQQMELKRMKFFVEMLSGFQDVLGELVNPSKLTQLHSQLRDQFDTLKDDRLAADLQEWSQKFGAAQPLRCPQYEEYTPEMRSITGNSKKANKKEVEAASNGGVILTRQVFKTTEFPDVSVDRLPTNQPQRLPQPPIQLKPDRTSTAMSDAISERTSTIKSESSSHETFETLTTPNVTLEPTERREPQRFGRPARVLYDYRPLEADEISLKSGEMLEVISGPDELGWCYGRKNEVEGLFPSKFVAVI